MIPPAGAARGAALVSVCATLLSLGAPGRAAERFRLVESPSAETLERDVRSAASVGFRVLASAQGTTLDGRPHLSTLTRRVEAGAGSYDYVVVSASGKLEDAATMRRLNALGEAGYRLAASSILARRVDDWWLPDEAYDAQVTMILERGSSPARYGYEAIKLTERASFERALTERGRDGFDVLALVNSARRVRALLGRRLDAPVGDGPAPPSSYRLLYHAKRLGLRRALKKAAGTGLQVIAATDPSIHAPPLVLLGAASPPRSRDYKIIPDPVEKQRKGRLVRVLDKHGRRGFRLAPRGISASALVLERTPGDTTPRQFEVLSSRRAPGLSRALDDAISRGGRFVALVPGAGPAETLTLVERPTARPVAVIRGETPPVTAEDVRAHAVRIH